MCTHISKLIRGKDKPIYSRGLGECGDICVVVNAANVKINGRKKFFKMYRKHTEYPGGLQEVALPAQLRKDPTRIITHAVR